jgi:hypothetical protein
MMTAFPSSLDSRPEDLRRRRIGLREPPQLVREFLAHPPLDFSAFRTCGAIPAFVARFDLLTTADPSFKRFIRSLPFFRYWKRLLQPRTYFVGTTVTEYAVLASELDPVMVADRLLRCEGKEYAFTIVKDLPHESPLIDNAQSAHCEKFMAALCERGFVLLEGQALAYVPIDFPDVEAYLARLSYRRRKDIRRKLRSRDKVRITTVSTGDSMLRDPGLIDRIYQMYLNVYEQSEIHFDCLRREFFAAVLHDASNGGVIFFYHQGDELIGFNLCFATGGALVDKFVGFVYPQARDLNLYFVSWMHNLEYALQRGLATYIAGWSDPQIKAYLGARFTMTRHAVFARNPLMRALLRRFAARFQNDSVWAEKTDASDCP